MKKKTTNSKIDPAGWYSMQDIVRSGMFPWARSFWSVRNVVAMDARSKNLLKPGVVGTGRATKYHFKGENIIKFLREFEEGKAHL